MLSRMVIMLLVVGLFFGGIFGWKAFVAARMDRNLSAQGRPPVTVSTTRAEYATWTPVIRTVGTLRAGQGVNITAQEAGNITEILFESGQSVVAGEILARQYADDERARLEGLEAELRLNELNLERARDLLDQNLISQFDYDVRETDRDRAAAAVRNLRLTIEKKTIRAPFAGRLGIRRVDIGQHIEPGDEIVRLEALDRILVDFPVPQQALGVVSEGQRLRVGVDAYPGRSFPGKIRAIAPQAQSETRDLRLEGVVENADQLLLPGMFAEIEIELPRREQVVTLPQSAVTFSPYGESVFVVRESPGPDGSTKPVAKNIFVTTGDTRGDQVAVLSGIEAGDTVVSAGQIKLRDGTPVRIDNSVAVSNSTSPEPENN